jgi:glutathione synthase/RimK-type ligase-like ATP-grasp enzyme
MATILIPTFVSDLHATAATLYLERMGHKVVRWFGADFPEVSSISIAPADRSSSFISLGESGSMARLSEIDVFWNRRHSEPVIQRPLVDSDHELAMRESSLASRGMFSALSDSVFTVNHVQHARYAENKLIQLMRAQAVGFRVPKTLMSNDPRAIKEFIRASASTGAIYKAYKPAMWKTSQDGIAIAFTSEVTIDTLPSDAVLRLTPGIYQERLDKSFEVRVTCMGNHVVAVKLDSQAVADASMDWRGVSPHELKIQPIQLPREVESRCVGLLKSLNLLFGCIDLICTPGGEYVFLEINQMGQFLWIEESNPSIHLLDMFCRFLVSRDANFKYAPSGDVHSFVEMRKDAVALIAQDESAHRFAKESPYVYTE